MKSRTVIGSHEMNKKHVPIRQEALMRTPMQHSRKRLRAGTIALASAIVLLLGLAASPSAQARTYNVLYSFTGTPDGEFPGNGSLVQDKAGNLYGTTEAGGSYGCGVVFKLTKSGTETVLWNFTCGSDGGHPWDGLVLSGNTLYGTTYIGGSATCPNGQTGCGVVFEVDINASTEQVLYNFTDGADGGYPVGGLVLSSGVLYGGTTFGGSYGDGVVYKLVVSTGEETVLHSFNDSFGASPVASLTLDKTGKVLYGATCCGGFANYGVVFSQTTNGKAYEVLYTFDEAAGAYPYGALALDRSGKLYGTTYYGGSSDYGVVFEVAPKTRTETVLWNFTGGSDGGTPFGGVIWTKGGKLYGTTEQGGPSDSGTVFELVTGQETVLHSFSGPDGVYPICGLLEDSKGNLYGTTYEGGAHGYGTVWEIKP